MVDRWQFWGVKDLRHYRLIIRNQYSDIFGVYIILNPANFERVEVKSIINLFISIFNQIKLFFKQLHILMPQ